MRDDPNTDNGSDDDDDGSDDHDDHDNDDDERKPASNNNNERNNDWEEAVQRALAESQRLREEAAAAQRNNNQAAAAAAAAAGEFDRDSSPRRDIDVNPLDAPPPPVPGRRRLPYGSGRLFRRGESSSSRWRRRSIRRRIARCRRGGGIEFRGRFAIACR